VAFFFSQEYIGEKKDKNKKKRERFDKDKYGYKRRNGENEGMRIKL
jgi:hypothetical protein